jgi:hypothetical protein
LSIQDIGSGKRIAEADNYMEDAAQENRHAQGRFSSGRAFNGKGRGG